MRKLIKVKPILSFILVLIFTVAAISLPLQTVTASTASETKAGNAHVVFILNYNMTNAKVEEFYKYLCGSVIPSTVDSIYTDSITTALENESVRGKLVDADKIIMVGLQPTNDNLSTLKSIGKTIANLHYVSLHHFYKSPLDATVINTWSAYQVWVDMYYGNIADDKQLSFTDSDSKPSLISGLGLAIYLQYQINNNPCTDISYTDLTSKMTSETLKGIDEVQFNQARKLLTKDPLFTNNENDPLLPLNELAESPNSDQYKQKLYDVYDVFSNSHASRGIFSMDQTPAGTPICYNTVYLGNCKTAGDKVYAWNGSKWKLQTTYPLDEYALKVLTWSGGKWNAKVYRYTDNNAKSKPLKTSGTLDIQSDTAGNWYISINYFNNYYIYQLDKNLKVKYKVKVSDLTKSQYANFYLLSTGNVLLETYDSAETFSDDSDYNLRLYNNLQLIDLKSDRITQEYDTGYYPYGDVKVVGKIIYMRDKSMENIIVIDSGTGKVEKIIRLSEYENLIKPHNYSQELGSKYYYDFTISGKYLYLLKKTGVYRIDLENGTFRKIMDDSYNPFGIQDMKFLDFKVKDSDTFYILSVYFDAECATDFYIYAK